ncbi:MAG: alpha/beta fold hydrolase [Planctomycetes bacterium]|nr:alpha/beta fold hydrolase [Planctomycetota bacterium]
MTATIPAVHTEEVSIPSGPETLRGTLVTPAGGGPHPCAVLVHGLFSKRGSFCELPERLAQAGYAVLSFDWRGMGDSTGARGHVKKEWLIADTSAAVEYLRARPGVNPRVVGLVGHSMGGMAILATLANAAVKGMEGGHARLDTRVEGFTPGDSYHLRQFAVPEEGYRFALVVAASPVALKEEVSLPMRLLYALGYYLLGAPTRLLTGASMMVPAHLPYTSLFASVDRAEWGRKNEMVRAVGPIDNYRDLLSIEVYTDVMRLHVPALFLAGERDQLVPPAHSHRAFTRFRDRKEWLTVPHTGHFVFADRTRDAVYGHVVDWFNKWLKDYVDEKKTPWRYTEKPRAG